MEDKQVTVETHLVRKSNERRAIARLLELGWELAVLVGNENLIDAWATARDEYLPVLEGK